MGLRPTQHRCAAEALLRRLRKDGAPSPVHPLVDLCKAASRAFAIPLAVFDLAGVEGGLLVRPATVAKPFLTLGSVEERPDCGAVIFADAGGWAHLRRWTHRQGGRSAVRSSTSEALIVAEALHVAGREDVARLMTLPNRLTGIWPQARLSDVSPLGGEAP